MAARPKKLVKGATKFLNGSFSDSEDGEEREADRRARSGSDWTVPLDNRDGATKQASRKSGKLIRGSTSSFQSDEDEELGFGIAPSLQSKQNIHAAAAQQNAPRKRGKLIRGSTDEFQSDGDEELGFGTSPSLQSKQAFDTTEVQQQKAPRKRGKLIRGSTDDFQSDEDEELGLGHQLSQPSAPNRVRLVKGATQFLNGLDDDENISHVQGGEEREGDRKVRSGSDWTVPLDNRAKDYDHHEGARKLRSGTNWATSPPQKRTETVKSAVKLAGGKGAKKFQSAVRFAVAAHHKDDYDEVSVSEKSPSAHAGGSRSMKGNGTHGKLEEWLLRLGAEVLGEEISLDVDLEKLLSAAQDQSRERREQAQRLEESQSRVKALERETVKLQDAMHIVEQQRNDALSRVADPGDKAMISNSMHDMHMRALKDQVDQLMKDNKRLSLEVKQKHDSAQGHSKKASLEPAPINSQDMHIQSLRDQIDKLTQDNRILSSELSHQLKTSQNQSPETTPMVSKGIHEMHMNSLRDQIDELMKENRRLSGNVAEKQSELERMHELHVKLDKHLTERLTLDGSSLEERIPLLVDEYLNSQLKLDKQSEELHKLRKQSAVLDRLPNIQEHFDKKCADLDEQINLFQRVSHASSAITKTSINLESSRLEAQTQGFAPIVCVYDCEDEFGGLTRIIEIQAPGRHLENGSSSVSVDLQPLPNGVSVSLSCKANVPDTAQIVSPFTSFEAGTWEWRYEPTDGIWNISKYWGLEHGILALSMTQAPLSASLSNEAIAGSDHPAKIARKRKFKKRASLGMTVTSLQLLRDTTLMSQDGFVVEAASLFVGQRVRGPKGFAEVISVKRVPKQEQKFLSLSMGLETVSVLPDQTTFASTLTEDGAATSDYHEAVFGELQAGTTELLLHTTGGIEQNVLLTDVRRKKRTAVLFEISFASPGGGVFVSPTPNAKQAFVTLLGKQCEVSVAKKHRLKNVSSQAPIFSPRRGIGVTQWH